MSSFNTEWPMFVYGALKPGEISWPLIKEFVSDMSSCILQDHELVMAGGLPMAVSSVGQMLPGHKLTFKNLGEALRKIEALEAVGKVYKWTEGNVDNRSVNVLIPVKLPTKPTKLENWATADDPYFGMVIPHVHEILTRLIGNSRQPILAAENYKNYLEAQAAYLLLWTLFERILLFTREGYLAGSGHVKGEVRSTQDAPEWREAIEKTKSAEMMSVVPADNVFGKIVKLSENPFLFFYQMRNNIVHRGKSASADYKQLLKGLVLFLNVQSAFLQLNYQNVNDFWSKLMPEVEDPNLKYQINVKDVK